MTSLRTRAFALTASGALAFAGLSTIASSAQAITPSCGNSSLAVTHTPSNGATGHGSFVLLFRNVTGSTCKLYGYPGLDALSSTGHVLAHAKRTLHGFAGGASSVQNVYVQPGRFASAVVEWMNFNPVTSGPCTFSKYVAATPPNTSHTVRLTVSVSICDLQVHPTVAGTNGYNHFADAQREWIRGASVISAKQGIYWSATKLDLSEAGSVYSTQINQLKTLIALPDANQTPAQNLKYHQEISALNGFFGTPGLYT
jgi:hypothetical protein